MPSQKSSSTDSLVCPICGAPYQVTDGSDPQIVCATCGYVLLFFYELERMRPYLKPLPDNVRFQVKNNRKRIKKQLKLKRRRHRKYMKHLTHKISMLVLAILLGLVAVICFTSCEPAGSPAFVDAEYEWCAVMVGSKGVGTFKGLKVSDLDVASGGDGTSVSVVTRDKEGKVEKHYHWQGHNVSVITQW